MDTFPTPPFSLNLMLKTQDGIKVGTAGSGPTYISRERSEAEKELEKQGELTDEKEEKRKRAGDTGGEIK